MSSDMSNTAVWVDQLSKRYQIGIGAGRSGSGTLHQTATDLFAAPLRLLRRRPAATRQENAIWALQEINLQVDCGDVLGIMGSNGAGKSTLLKILAGITEPTAGRIVISGRFASLLEVGTGFHPELTGRENVYLNGAILGMTRQEIRRKFEQIVAFAETEKFIDTPVKRYSSGMYLRLAFAVAAHLEAEILLVDEVLAVGDAAFQRRCLGTMGQAAREGRTVLFVSHNMAAIRSLCRRAILIEQGRLQLDGEPSRVISAYLSRSAAHDPENGEPVFWASESERDLTAELSLRGVRLIGPSGAPQACFEADKRIQVELYYEIHRPLRGARLNLWVLTQDGDVAFISTDHGVRNEFESPGVYRSICVIPGGLLNRIQYAVEIDSDIPTLEKELLARREYVRFTVSGIGNHGSMMAEAWPGAVCPQLDWQIEKIPGIEEFRRPSRVPASRRGVGGSEAATKGAEAI
jgi:lipopolysaccharide transport system ATP-binding protein